MTRALGKKILNTDEVAVKMTKLWDWK